MSLTYANEASFTLAAPITSPTQTSVQRTSNANGLPGDSNGPASGTYAVLLASAGSFEIAYVTGGQGTYFLTLQRAAEAVAGTQSPLVYVPAGTTCRTVVTAADLAQKGAGGGSLSVATVTSATNLSAQYLYLCDASGAAFTVTLPAASGVSGQTILLRKTGTDSNVVTVSGSLDGATTPGALSVPGDSLDLISDGSTWRVVSAVQGPLTFDTSQNWTVPAGWHFIRAQCIFGGGGGGGGLSAVVGTSGAVYGGAGGNAGPVVMLESWPVAASDTLGVTIGAGGAGGTGAATSSSGIVNGGDGGDGGASYLSLNNVQLTSSGHLAPGGGGGNTGSNTAGEAYVFDTDSGTANGSPAAGSPPGTGGNGGGGSTAPSPISWGPVGGAMGGGVGASTNNAGLGGPGTTVTTWAVVPPANPYNQTTGTADGGSGGTSTTPGCGGGGGGPGVGGPGGNGGAGGPGQVTIWRLS